MTLATINSYSTAYTTRKAMWASHFEQDMLLTDLITLIGEYHGFLPTWKQVQHAATVFSPELLDFLRLTFDQLLALPILHPPLTRTVSKINEKVGNALVLPSELADENHTHHPMMRSSKNHQFFLSIGVKVLFRCSLSTHEAFTLGKQTTDGTFTIEQTSEFRNIPSLKVHPLPGNEALERVRKIMNLGRARTISPTIGNTIPPFAPTVTVVTQFGSCEK